jgi:hypothetical protein
MIVTVKRAYKTELDLNGQARRQFAGETKRLCRGERWLESWGALVKLSSQAGTWSRKKQEPNTSSSHAD